MPHGFTEKEWAKAWRYEQFENKVKATGAKNVLINNGPQHYNNVWKEKEQQQRQQEAERKRQSQARQQERDRQARIKQQQELKRQQEELQREERARRWKQAQEDTARKKAKLDKENPPKKPKLKPNRKKFGDRASDNLQDEFGIGKDAPFDMHKVPLNLYETGMRAGMAYMKTYAEHQHDQNKAYQWGKKGYGSQGQPLEHHFFGRTEEDPSWKVCEYDNVKRVVEGGKKALSTAIIAFMTTKNPYAATVAGAYGGTGGYLDETEKQDVKIHECEQNKKPRL